jgi:hypothetical protein
VGFVSFGIFFTIHAVSFHRLRPEKLLRSLAWCVGAIVALPVVLVAILWSIKAAGISAAAWVMVAGLALLINCLLVMGYIMCFFVPYETSVRMRLVREIAGAGPRGLSMQELLGNYNPETILSIRLRRLVDSGDVVEKEGLYQCRRSRNFFFILYDIAKVIGKWIGR